MGKWTLYDEKIYWKGVKRKIDKFIDRVIDCILIFTDWLG